MKTDTEILNDIARKTSILRLLTEEECALLKQTLLQMHNDIISLCDKCGITIMLEGGSCLGAIRHTGTGGRVPVSRIIGVSNNQ